LRTPSSEKRRRFAHVRLIHVDHQLQPASAAWSAHCRRLARAWKVPFDSLTADIARKPGASLEAAARDARYALLARAMLPGEVLVTAQHRDDQAETLLLQLFRGAGVAGLAAMPSIAPFGPGRIARPLLDTSRAQILACAQRYKLRWIEDPTNEQTAFGRNFLRHRVMPVIRERWPGVDLAIARSAAHMADAQKLLDAQAQSDLAAAADGGGLNVAALRALPAARRRNLVRAFIARAGLENAPGELAARDRRVRCWRRGPTHNPRSNFPAECCAGAPGRLELEVSSEVRGGASVEIVSKSWRWPEDRVFVVNEAGDSLTLDRRPHRRHRSRQASRRRWTCARAAAVKKLRPGARARTPVVEGPAADREDSRGRTRVAAACCSQGIASSAWAIAGSTPP
jgi:tRNA(Ile)-lysidine synthetase-like protein